MALVLGGKKRGERSENERQALLGATSRFGALSVDFAMLSFRMSASAICGNRRWRARGHHSRCSTEETRRSDDYPRKKRLPERENHRTTALKHVHQSARGTRGGSATKASASTTQFGSIICHTSPFRTIGR